MAGKISTSILRGLDRLRKSLVRAPAKNKSQKPARKAARTPRASPSQERSDAQADSSQFPLPKPEKKAPNQPWYRHRQRW